MLAQRLLLPIVIALLIITPLVLFTDILDAVPHVGVMFTRSYWTEPITDLESIHPYTLVVMFAGPICIVFIIFWHLWIQRNKRESILAVVARAQDVHIWLKTWAKVSENPFEGNLRTIHLKAKRLFRKLDRLMSLEDSMKWRWWYTVHLALFYLFNASKITAFSDLRTEPPAGHWPTAEAAMEGLDSANHKLLENALEFTRDFTDGAKASTGLNLMLHTIVGGSFGVVLSVILGGASVLALLHNLGSWIPPVLSSLTLSLVLGVSLGHCWYWIYCIRHKSSRPTKNKIDDKVPAAADS